MVLNMNMNMNMKTILIVVIICLVVIVTYYIYTGLGSGLGSGSSEKTKINCSKGCPVTKDQNEIYKLHEDYKQQRQKNDALNKSSGGFFFQQKNSNKGPANIFIIRHGERVLTNFPLNCNGILRSTYIPNLIGDLNNNGFGINAIVTMNNYLLMHEQQTIMLTSWLLNIPIFIYGEQNDQEITINTIFNNPYFNGKNVLICWEHTCIQELLQQIINVGPKVKGLTNYQFVNPEKKKGRSNSGLPYWHMNNYQSVMHFDDQLNFNTFSENISTCFAGNEKLTYGLAQTCTAIPSWTATN